MAREQEKKCTSCDNPVFVPTNEPALSWFCICAVNSEYVNDSFMSYTAFEEQEYAPLPNIFWNYPFLSRLYELYLSLKDLEI